MTGTALTWHAAAPGGLRRLAATAGPAGVVLGRQHSGEVVPVRLFRPEPTRAVLVGGSWLARLVVFRSLGAGAQVHITTATPDRWSTVGSAAGAPEQVTIGIPPLPSPSGSMRPRLWVNDIGLGGEDTRLGAWETTLTVLPTLTPTSTAQLAEANVALLQRLSPPDADVCAATLRLPAGTETRLYQMHNELLAVVVAGVVRFISFGTTPIEDELLGPPRRG